MFCSKCGRQASDSDKFCSQCGNPISTVDQKKSSEPVPSEGAPMQTSMEDSSPDEPSADTKISESNPMRNKAMIVAGAVVVVLLLGYYFTSYLPKQKELEIRQSCYDETWAMARSIFATNMKKLSEEELDANVNRYTGFEEYKRSYENCLSKNGVKP